MMNTRSNLRRKRPADLSSDDTNEMKSWRFVRVMPTSILQESMERIPCEFANKFSGKASISTSFSDPNQKSWTVKVTKKRDNLQLCAGWGRFVKDNSVHDGDMIFFKYKGNCEFKVRIFDPAGCELLQCHHIHHAGKQKIGKHLKVEEEEEVDEEDNDRNPHRTRCKSSSDLKEHATNHEENSVKLKEFCLSLKNPFFLAKTSSSRSELLIPFGVIKTFDLQFDKTILLEDPKKRKWETRVVIWKCGPARTTRVRGWNKFRKFNLVTENDACVCEFIPGKGPTCRAMKVHIFRDQKEEAALLIPSSQKQ